MSVARVSMGAVDCFVVLLCLYVVSAVKVQTSLGELEGGSFFIHAGREIFTFLGIPYAVPPIGVNRFEEPKPVKGWPGTWPALDYGSACIQPSHIYNEGTVGNEDCLYLNVYTPTVSDTKNLPVLMYFHGGAFTVGESTNYNPKFLLENDDIVFVSANYRLGPFGFLSTEDDVVPGNNGLKDQVLALRWVQEHIAEFGGDSTRVTISGNSAGGVSVHYHYLSPLSRGLFDKGISSSGSVLKPSALTEKPLQKAKMLAASVGCPTSSTVAIVNCLKRRTAKQILLKLEPLFMPWLSNPFTPFGPVVEKTTENPFLSEQPFSVMQRGDVYDRPWLVSVTTEEGLYPAAAFLDQDDLLQSLDKGWNSIAPHLLDFNYTVQPDQLTSVSDKVRQFYFGKKSITKKTQDVVIKMLSDRLYQAGVALAASLQASVTSSPVYFHIFGYRGKTSLSQMYTKSKAYYGVSHFDDMFYIMALSEKINMEANDEAMTLAMTKMWATFIKTGKPAPSDGIRWDPVPKDSFASNDLTALLITSHKNMEMTKRHNFGNLEFWNSLKLDENVDYSKVLLAGKDEL